MRNVVNISLPKELNQIVEKEVKKGQYSTKSEFFRHLLRSWMEAKLLRELQESDEEFAKGKGRLLKSVDDLDRF